MKTQERKNRIIARGEVTDHAHIVTGDANITRTGNETVIEVFGPAKIRHLIESNWVNEGVEVWTKEHRDIDLQPGRYKYVPQVEYDPYEDAIRKVQD
jgi:hypothetical protein